MATQQNKVKTPLRGAIVAMTSGRFLTRTWEQIIGEDNRLPWNYSEDLKHFKKLTMGSVVIMGRITWESLGCRELPGRKNIVISRSEVPRVEHYGSVEQAIKAYPKRRIWVIGGAQIYEVAMPYLDLLYITYVPHTPDHTIGDNTVSFPEIDLSHWRPGKKIKLPGNKNLYYIIYRRINSD